MSRDLFGSRWAGLAAAAALLSFSGFAEYTTNGPREKTAMVFFLLCNLLAVVRQRWLGAGVSISLATLVWQPVLLVGLATAVTGTIALRPSSRVPALVRFTVGALIPATVCVLYFAIAGALREFIDAFLLINMRYTESSPLTTDFADKWSALNQAYGASLWIFMVGLVALMIFTLLAIHRRGRNGFTSAPVAAVGTGAFVGLLWSLRDFNGWPDTFVLLPLAAIGIGGLAKFISERLPARTAQSLISVWLIGAAAVAVTYSITERHEGLARGSEIPWQQCSTRSLPVHRSSRSLHPKCSSSPASRIRLAIRHSGAGWIATSTIPGLVV